MKRLKKGFTLIELLVVIAIIGILATTLAPKLREQLAKAKDAKAIAVLGASRTIGEIVFMENLVNDSTSAPAISEIHAKLDSKAQAITTTAGAVTIGGSGDGSKVTSYGGTISLATPTVANGDEVTVKFADTASGGSGTAGKYSSEGKKWDEY